LPPVYPAALCLNGTVFQLAPCRDPSNGKAPLSAYAPRGNHNNGTTAKSTLTAAPRTERNGSGRTRQPCGQLGGRWSSACLPGTTRVPSRSTT